MGASPTNRFPITKASLFCWIIYLLVSSPFIRLEGHYVVHPQVSYFQEHVIKFPRTRAVSRGLFDNIRSVLKGSHIKAATGFSRPYKAILTPLKMNNLSQWDQQRKSISSPVLMIRDEVTNSNLARIIKGATIKVDFQHSHWGWNPNHPVRRRWGGCLSGFLCFVPSKAGKRVVPASRILDANMPGNRAGGTQPIDISNQASTYSHLYAPPSSPASFSNSGLPSTVQSPSGFPSMSTGVFSPGGPASTMFVTGPYAHETQLVSPPVFSNFTTEPSTAPVTPPPELVQMTTPSSPDVPFAQLLSSSLCVDNESKECAVSSPPFMPSCYVAYQLYPGSPTSYLVSPNLENSKDDSCLSFPAQEAFFPSRLIGVSLGISKSCLQAEDPDLACPPQFYLDQALQSFHCGRNLCNIEEDARSVCVGHVDDACEMDAEQHIEAYRASFGFSSEEIVNAKMHCAGLSESMEGSFIVSHLAAAAAHCLSQGESARPSVGNVENKHMGYLNSAVSRILDPSSEQISECMDGRTASYCIS